MKSPYPKTAYHRNAEVYKLLANSERLEILSIIRNQEASVEDLVEIMGISKVSVSQHLSVLQQAGLVLVRVEGLRAYYYKIVDPRIVEPCSVLHELRQQGAVL